MAAMNAKTFQRKIGRRARALVLPFETRGIGMMTRADGYTKNDKESTC
jgi:hypothetical protein